MRRPCPRKPLYLLNSTFVRRQSLSLAENLLSERDRSAASRIRKAYQLTLGRAPNKQEVTPPRADKFLAEYEASFRPLPHAEASPPVKASAEAAKTIPDPVNQNDLDHASLAVIDETVQPKSPKAAAWMSLVQALYASAEFRYVR